jgi:hypothetical protein
LTLFVIQLGVSDRMVNVRRILRQQKLVYRSLGIVILVTRQAGRLQILTRVSIYAPITRSKVLSLNAYPSVCEYFTPALLDLYCSPA